jgi:nicotinamidase-related amidase
LRAHIGSSRSIESAAVSSRVALLIVDVINDFTFDDAAGVLRNARPMARRIRELKMRARQIGVPTIYVNDHFGRWRSDFRRLVARSTRSAAPGRLIARLLRPDSRDYFVLKPRHSAFFATPLALLLEHLGVHTLILTGVLADMCIQFTANDAYMRGYRVIVPSDCVAARTARDRSRALSQLRRALAADTRPSRRLDTTGLARLAEFEPS